MQNLVPTQNEINEKLEKLDIQLNNSPNLQSLFIKIKNSKHILDDLSKFDLNLVPFNYQNSSQILEILCILILKNINFNFEFLMHKKNIHEKQNVKIKSKKMKENIKMPNLKRILREYLKRNCLKLDLKSIRIFIIYCILEEGKKLSFEDLCEKNESEISVYGGEVSTDSSNGIVSEDGGYDGGSNQEDSQGMLSQDLSQGRLSPLNPCTSLNPCSSLNLDPLSLKSPPTLNLPNPTLNLPPNPHPTTTPIYPPNHSPPITHSPYVYDGPFQIFYFIHYLISNNLFSLRDSLLKSKFPCDWSLLGLPQMNNFVLNELRFIKDISILSSIILQCKSHLILLRFLPKLLFKLKFNRSFHILVLSSFDPKKIQDTSLLLIELYKEDKHKTNRILRDLIVGFKPPLSQIFFTYFKDLNLNYFECLKIYLKKLPFLSKEDLKKILKSEYFSILIEEIEDFNLVMNVMRDNNLMDFTLNILKNYKWSPTYKNIEKIKILYKVYAIEKSLFVEEIKKMVHEMHKENKKKRCLGVRDSEVEKGMVGKNMVEKGSSLRKVSNFSEVIKVENQSTLDTTFHTPSINNPSSINNPPINSPSSINPHSNLNSPQINPKSSINPHSSSIFSLFSNVSTIEDLFKVDFYKKEFNIKKSKKVLDFSFNSTIKNFIDLIFIYRDESLGKSYLKKIYKLDPNHFLKNLKENQKEDVFFSKALKMGIRQNNNLIFWISELPFYKKEDYWSVTLRKGLGIGGVEGNREEGREEGGEGNEGEVGNGDKDKGDKGNRDVDENVKEDLDSLNTSLNNPSTSLNSSHSLNSLYSTLKDSYLDLSQFNESKLILESKIEIEKILKDNKEIKLRKSIPKGIVMKESSIVIHKKLSKFILAMKVYQIEKEGIQIIIEIVGGGDKGKGEGSKMGDNKGIMNNPSFSPSHPFLNFFRLGSINGKLFYEISKGNLKERKFIDQDLENKDFIYFELISSGSNLKININSRVYNLKFFKIEKIVIGEGSKEGEGEGSRGKNDTLYSFKGVINKFLLVEGSDYKNCRIVNLEGAYLYLKVLDRLERYLRYHNLFGVYLDSPYPYYFNKKGEIELKNVM